MKVRKGSVSTIPRPHPSAESIETRVVPGRLDRYRVMTSYSISNARIVGGFVRIPAYRAGWASVSVRVFARSIVASYRARRPGLTSAVTTTTVTTVAQRDAGRRRDVHRQT